MLVLGFGVWAAVTSQRTPGDASGDASSPRGTGASSLTAGPRRVIDGVPVGYAHTRPGAVAAAVNFELARSRPDYITDTSVRHTVLRHIMAASAAPTQITNDDTNAAAAMNALGLTPDGHGPGGATWVMHSAPLGVQVASYSSQVATVHVWMAEITGVVGDPNTVLPPSGSYSTYVLTLAWEQGDWRITSITTRSGPVPAASTNQSPSTITDWQQSGPFDPPRTLW